MKPPLLPVLLIACGLSSCGLNPEYVDRKVSAMTDKELYDQLIYVDSHPGWKFTHTYSAVQKEMARRGILPYKISPKDAQ